MQENRKKYAVVVCGIIAIVCFASIAILVLGDSEDTVSRYQWIQMLAEKFGMEEYASAQPLVPDVDEENEYYSYIQAACEWGIIEEGEKFDGNKPVTGQYVALTSMLAIGQYKIQIYLGTMEELSDNDYLDLAIQENVISKSQMHQRISAEECSAVLERAGELYLSALWKDDMCNIAYQQDVIDLSSATIISMNDDLSQVQLTGGEFTSLAVGDIVILKHPKTGEQFAAEIAAIGAANTLTLSNVELEQVVDSLLLSDIAVLSATDILTYYGLNEDLSARTNNTVLMPVNSSNYVAEPVLNTNMHNKGFAIALETRDNTLNFMLTDHNTGLTYTLPIEEELEPTADVSATVDVKKIDVGTQVTYSAKEGLTYAHAQVESDIQVSGNVSISKDKKIPLFKAPIYLGTGIVGVELKFYLVLSVDGTIQIEAEMPLGISVEYVKGAGVRNHPLNYNYTQPAIYAECNAGVAVRTEAILKILMIVNALDVEGDIGVNVNATLQNRQGSNIQSCLDMSINMPVITVYLSGDDEIEPSTLLNLANISAEWNIIDAGSAPLKTGFHIEWDLDGKVSFVEKCTYNNETSYDSSNQDEDIYDDGLVEFSDYVAYFDSPFVDKGDYYEVIGRLTEQVTITDTQLETMNPNDTYVFGGVEFVYKEKKVVEEENNHKGQVYYEFLDSNGNLYKIVTWNYVGNGDGEKEYSFDTFSGPGYGTTFAYVVLDDSYKFIIPKTLDVSIIVNCEEDGQGRKIYDSEFFTMEDIYNNMIEDYAGQRLGYDLGLTVSILMEDSAKRDIVLLELCRGIPNNHEYFSNSN